MSYPDTNQIYLANKYRLANIFGLDANIAQNNVALTDAMQDIENIDAFLEYCRDYRESISFTSKLEKLDILSHRYKRLQEDAKINYDLANSFTDGIIMKIDTIRIEIKNAIEAGHRTPFSSARKDGEKYFTDQELNALIQLKCTPMMIIELHEQNLLRDELFKLYISKYAKKKKYDALTAPQKKVMALIGAKN